MKWIEIKEEILQELHRMHWNLHTIKENRNWEVVIRKIAIGILLITLFFQGVEAKQTQADAIQQGIAKEIVRFHCIANSDSDEDQAVKLKVKEAVVALLKEQMDQVDSKKQAEEVLSTNMDLIEKEAIRVLRENGFSYGVNVSLEDTQFPIKVYGDVVLPAGIYEALCVRLGEAEGKNWWCIVFPTLCFVDCTYGYVPEESKEELKYLLTEEEYDAITEKKEVKVRVKFKLLDILKEYLEQ